MIVPPIGAVHGVETNHLRKVGVRVLPLTNASLPCLGL